jgi:hypothetical protein
MFAPAFRQLAMTGVIEDWHFGRQTIRYLQ